MRILWYACASHSITRCRRVSTSSLRKRLIAMPRQQTCEFSSQILTKVGASHGSFPSKVSEVDVGLPHSGNSLPYADSCRNFVFCRKWLKNCLLMPQKGFGTEFWERFLSCCLANSSVVAFLVPPEWPGIQSSVTMLYLPSLLRFIRQCHDISNFITCELNSYLSIFR